MRNRGIIVMALTAAIIAGATLYGGPASAEAEGCRQGRRYFPVEPNYHGDCSRLIRRCRTGDLCACAAIRRYRCGERPYQPIILPNWSPRHELDDRRLPGIFRATEHDRDHY